MSSVCSPKPDTVQSNDFLISRALRFHEAAEAAEAFFRAFCGFLTGAVPSAARRRAGGVFCRFTL